MKQTPVLYTAPMVRAQLSGDKTQTRRLVKGEALKWLEDFDPAYVADPANGLCRYGYAGDLLWGRETARAIELEDGQDGVRYEADGTFRPIKATAAAAEAWLVMHTYRHGKGLVVPSIHMPRWACRLERELTSVSIERLQAISEADAIAEGIERGVGFPGWYRGPLKGDSHELQELGRTFRIPTAFPCLAYRALWESINGLEGPSSWDANPWIWRLAFRELEAPA